MTAQLIKRPTAIRVVLPFVFRHWLHQPVRAAIAAGGSTLRDFAQTDGALGYFQHRFRTYDREGEPCFNDPCKGVIARKVQAGRSTFYCPQCQV